MSAAEYLVSWLRFRESATHDESGDTWQTIGNPTVNANKLLLDGQSAIRLNGMLLGGQSFTLDAWFTLGNNVSWNRLIGIRQPRTGHFLLSVLISRNDASKLELWVNNHADCSVDMGQIIYPTASYVGQRIHLKVVYNVNYNRVRLYVNDSMVAEVTSRPAYQRDIFDIYIGGLSSSGYLVGAVEEFRLYDGLASTTGNGTTPTADDYDALAADFYALGAHSVLRPPVERIVKKSANFTADFQRRIKNEPLTWRYYNKGDAHDLTQTPTYLTDLPATKSTTGYAFYQATRAKCFDLPATPQIWAKFDVYFDGSNRWRAFNGGDNSNPYNVGITAQTNGYLSLVQNSAVKQNTSSICKTNQLQTVLLHMVSGINGLIEAWVDGTKIYTYNGDVNHGDDFADFYLQSDGAGTFFSDVLISNEELIPKTTVIAAIERRLSNVVEATAAIERDLRRTTEVTAAIERRLINEIQTSTAIERRLIKSVETTAAIERILRHEVTTTAAIEREIITRTITAEFAIERRLINPNTLTFDIEQQIVRSEELIFDLETELTFSGLLTRILPDSILDDPKFKASAIALDMQIIAVFAAVKEVLHIPRLDELTGTILDLLAWQLHVDFYEPLYLSDEQKRSLIRQSIAWHRRKGTVAAVEELVAAVFKGATIQEWFDYGGEPYYFRIIAKSFAKSAEDYRTFRRAINVAKNVRSHLDYIAVDFSPEEPLKVKVGFGRRAVTGTKRILRDKPKDLRLRIGIGTRRYVIGHIGPILPPAPVEPMRLRISLGFGRLIRTGNIRWRNDHGNADPLDDDDPLPDDYVGSYIWFRWLAATGKRGMRIRNPRDDVTEADLKTFMQYVVDNEVLRNSKGDLLTTALRASVLKTQEEIIPLDTSVHILPKQEEIILGSD